MLCILKYLVQFFFDRFRSTSGIPIRYNTWILSAVYLGGRDRGEYSLSPFRPFSVQNFASAIFCLARATDSRIEKKEEEEEEEEEHNEISNPETDTKNFAWLRVSRLMK
jgi:hypothetical protein